MPLRRLAPLLREITWYANLNVLYRSLLQRGPTAIATRGPLIRLNDVVIYRFSALAGSIHSSEHFGIPGLTIVSVLKE